MSALTQVVASLIAAVTAAAVGLVTAQSAAPTLACVAPPAFARFDIPLKHVAERISAQQPLTIVAVGSSSTFGAGASLPAMSYPSQLAVELGALLPRTSITVINRGVNGETAQEMLARFDRDVLAEHPDLVLWQVGSNAVLLGRPIAPTGLLIGEGLKRLKGAGSDVVLIDPQYAPKVIAQNDQYDVDQMVALISTTSRDMHINLFQRFALMRYWRLTKGLPFNAFLSKDELHMNDWSYGCIAKLLARAIAEAATRVTVR
ncbi:MAG TPA: GDSL-type esterase/lipase family protein [Pseudolabrys sp.]|nr:GDSL-type esterase/lipase family protein [Pseudolabrys sp.]